MKPRAEQLRFRSTKTGNHIIDAYLEAAEYGDRTLADLLADIFDADGAIRTDIYHFRINPATRYMQVRIGDWAGPEAGWVDVDNGQLFRERGAYTVGQAYYQTDFADYLGGRYLCIVAHTASTSVPDPTKFVLIATSLEAADVLAQLLTVDGAGSGLDADLLDGQSSAYYRNASNMNAGTLPSAQFNDTSHGLRSGGSLHAEVTAQANGFMTSAQFTKLNGIETGAQQTSKEHVYMAILAAPLLADIDGADMRVPYIDVSTGELKRSTWVNIRDKLKFYFDTLYFAAASVLTDAQHGQRSGGNLHPAATGTVNGFMTSAQFTKLNGIETGADVTDLDNVRAALSASPEANPIDATMLYAADRKFSWLNVKAVLKAYFDPLYQAALGFTPVNKAGDTMTGTLTTSGEFSSTAPISLRLKGAATAALMYYDNSDFYVLFSDTPTGSYNTIRPLRISRTTGKAHFQDIVTGDITVSSAANYLRMTDTDAGQTRYVHHNSGSIGFLGSAGDWVMNVNDAGALWTKQLGDLNTRIETRGQAWAEWAVAQVPGQIAGVPVNGIGGYLFCENNNQRSAGQQVNGSELGYSGSDSIDTGHGISSGSYKVCGYNSANHATLYLRYA